jgi:SAM-dependent methyltransferase
MKVLNLGAGNKVIEGACNQDRVRHRPEIDVAHDLNELPWPWEDESFDHIVASAVLEHLRIDLVQSLDECWRILRPGGSLRCKVPYWKADRSYSDPTHHWQFTLSTFHFFDPETTLGARYDFYTPRKWEIVKKPHLNPERTSVVVTMRVRKRPEECNE